MSLVGSSEGRGENTEIKTLKQRRKGFLCQLTKAINRAQSYFDGNKIDEREVGALKENIEFALIKLKSVTEQICSTASLEECEKSNNLYHENSERTKNILSICEKFLENLDSETQSTVSEYAFDQLYGSTLNKMKKSGSACSSKSDDSKTSQKSQRLLAIQNENRAKRNLELLKKRQQLEEAEATEEYIRAIEKREIVQLESSSSNDSVNSVDIKRLIETNKSKIEIKLDDKNVPVAGDKNRTNIRESYPYFTNQNIENSHDRDIAPLNFSKNELHTSFDERLVHTPKKNILFTKPATPYPSIKKVSEISPLLVETKTYNEPVDAFIDSLIEGQETKLQEGDHSLTAMSALQRDFESRLLPSY